MKKIFFLIMLIVSTLSFSWEITDKLDKFGDPTGIKILAEEAYNSKNNFLIAEEIENINKNNENIKSIKFVLFSKDYYKFKFSPSKKFINLEIKTENGKLFTIRATVDNRYKVLYFHDRKLVEYMLEEVKYKPKKNLSKCIIKIAVPNFDDSFSIYKFNFSGIETIFKINDPQLKKYL